VRNRITHQAASHAACRSGDSVAETSLCKYPVKAVRGCEQTLSLC